MYKGETRMLKLLFFILVICLIYSIFDFINACMLLLFAPAIFKAMCALFIITLLSVIVSITDK